MNVVLYKNTSVPEKINKQLTSISTLTGTQLRNAANDADISLKLNPGFDLRTSGCNYFEWNGNYYFRDSIDYESNSIQYLNGKIDLLMTYKAAILELDVRAERSENSGNNYIEDPELKMAAGKYQVVRSFPNSISGAEADGCYVLTTATL